MLRPFQNSSAHIACHTVSLSCNGNPSLCNGRMLLIVRSPFLPPTKKRRSVHHGICMSRYARNTDPLAVLGRKRDRRLNVFHGSEHSQPLSRVKEDDGIPHVPRVGLYFTGRSPCSSCCNVPAGGYYDQSPLKTWIDRCALLSFVSPAPNT